MRRFLIFILIAVGLGLTLTACTSYSRRGYPYGYPRGDSYGMHEVRDIADDLEEATDRVLDTAEDYDRRSDREDYAIDRLEDLHDEARDFKDEVDDNGRDPGDTRDDFAELMQAYGRAREAMRVLYAGNDLYRDFERVSRLMSELNRFYGYGQRRYGYYPGK